MANCFATSVGSKALTVKQAVVIASICEFFGALLMGSNVAKTIRKGIADVNCYKDNPGLLIYGMTCVIIAVAIWLVLASYLELPVSTTHSCVGGIIGMTLMTRSTRCVIWNKDPDNMAFENFPWTGGVAQIVISWVLSPVASGVCAAALYAVVRYGIFAWENCYLRARVAFPLVVFFTVTVNVTYFIVKGAKGQAERFGTVGMVREAKEEGNLAPAIGMGAIFGAVAAAVAAGMLPMLSKKVEAEDFTDAVAGARADPADVEAKAVDAEAGAAAVDAEATELDGAKAYIGGQLTRDTHKDLKTDKVVGAIHANVKEFDPRAEFFFRYVQVFTAMVDSFSHGANDVANAMGPFAAAYLAYKKGEVRSKQEMPAEVMLWILALGGAGIVVGLATYGYKIMNAMGVGLRRPPFAFVVTAAARWRDLDAPYLCPFASMASTRRRERVPPNGPAPGPRPLDGAASTLPARWREAAGLSGVLESEIAALDSLPENTPPTQGRSRVSRRRVDAIAAKGKEKRGRRKKYRIPRQAPDARRVAPHTSNQSHARRVPELHRRAVRAHAQVGPARRPAHGRDAVALF